MPTYLIVNRPPADYRPSPDLMTKWTDWFDRLASALVDRGNPVFTRQVIGDTPSTTVLGGYTLISADDLPAAVALRQHLPGAGRRRRGGGRRARRVQRRPRAGTLTSRTGRPRKQLQACRLADLPAAGVVGVAAEGAAGTGGGVVAQAGQEVIPAAAAGVVAAELRSRPWWRKNSSHCLLSLRPRSKVIVVPAQSGRNGQSRTFQTTIVSCCAVRTLTTSGPSFAPMSKRSSPPSAPEPVTGAHHAARPLTVVSASKTGPGALSMVIVAL